MAQIDQIIDFLVKQKGDKFVIKNSEKWQLFIGSQSKPVGTIMNTQQIQKLVSEVVPDEHREALQRGQPVSFRYPAPAGEKQIEVEQRDGQIQVVIKAPEEPAAPPSPPPSEVPAAKESLVTEEGVGKKKVKHLDELFMYLYEHDCSDLHVSSNEHPMVRRHGVMQKLTQYEVSDPDYLKKLLFEITPKRNQEEWEECYDTDFAYELKGIARFRCNLFADRHGIGGVFRLIPNQLYTPEQLGLTKEMLDLCYLSKGLVLVTGPTGSGKTTTLATLIDHCNQIRDDHIITIEDPIEFVHSNKRCLINQRQVHVHTQSFARALRAALREDPDIVLLGEMRDLETIAIALETAETGHLVFGTCHTSSAPSTVDRIIDQFPPEQQEQIRVMLSESLAAVIAQTLCRKKEGGRIAAYEFLLCDSATRNLIREAKTFQLPSVIQVGRGKGMMTMNDSLVAHVKNGVIEPHEAYLKALDKVGLLQLFEKENIDYKPGEEQKPEQP